MSMEINDITTVEINDLRQILVELMQLVAALTALPHPRDLHHATALAETAPQSLMAADNGCSTIPGRLVVTDRTTR